MMNRLSILPSINNAHVFGIARFCDAPVLEAMLSSYQEFVSRFTAVFADGSEISASLSEFFHWLASFVAITRDSMDDQTTPAYVWFCWMYDEIVDFSEEHIKPLLVGKSRQIDRIRLVHYLRLFFALKSKAVINQHILNVAVKLQASTQHWSNRNQQSQYRDLIEKRRLLVDDIEMIDTLIQEGGTTE